MKDPKQLTIVIKLGTSSIVDEKSHEPILSILSLIVETAVNLRKNGHRVVIVSSGAVGVGLRRMDLEARPKHLPKVQALAAIGQCRLISLWDSLFAHLRQPVAQILLTRNDIANRTQYINAQNTLNELFSMGVIPIVNENDTLAVAEIKFGDNDTLSAITAGMIHADYLFLMTDVDCLYDKNPRTNPDAKPIEVVSDINSLAADVSSAGSALGTGGMSTKIVAARLATSAGVTTIITKSSKPGNISGIVSYLQSLPSLDSTGSSSFKSCIAGQQGSDSSVVSATPGLDYPLHTRFIPSPNPIQSRSFWLLHGLAPHGTVYIDRGALTALLQKASLLPAGVVGVAGTFAQHEAVRICVVNRPNHSSHSMALDGDVPTTIIPNSALFAKAEEVGRALVNYSSVEIERIKGVRSSHIESLLGYADSEYVALRENIGFFGQLEEDRERSRPGTPGPGEVVRRLTPDLHDDRVKTSGS